MSSTGIKLSGSSNTHQQRGKIHAAKDNENNQQ